MLLDVVDGKGKDGDGGMCTCINLFSVGNMKILVQGWRMWLKLVEIDDEKFEVVRIEIFSTGDRRREFRCCMDRWS